MKPANNRQRQPRRTYSTANADRMAAELAQDMIVFLATQYENASSDSERLDIILRFGSVMRDLQRAVNKVARQQQRQRRFGGAIETKGSR